MARRGRPPHPGVLTPAEWRVLEELREGRTNAEIAVRLRGVVAPLLKPLVGLGLIGAAVAVLVGLGVLLALVRDGDEGAAAEAGGGEAEIGEVAPGSIAFVMTKGVSLERAEVPPEAGDLYAISPDGTALVRLTHRPETVKVSPVWSPHGRVAGVLRGACGCGA